MPVFDMAEGNAARPNVSEACRTRRATVESGG